MKPIFNRQGLDIREDLISLDAWNWLPDWLKERLFYDRKSFRDRVLFAAFTSFLLAGFLTAIFALTVPWAVSALVSWSNPFSEVLEVMNHWLFFSAFGITLYPIVWVGLGLYIFMSHSKERLEVEYQELLREIAFREGQDQANFRDVDGRYTGRLPRTPWY